jgi:isopenicillin N synthase-like dioxygenase
MMMRWTNDLSLSNLHRVINKSGRERYSVPFFSGNPDFEIKCLPTCEDAQTGGAKYPLITIGEWMTGRYAGTSKEKALTELRVEAGNV